jgi:type IV secretion system protein TrbF
LHERRPLALIELNRPKWIVRYASLPRQKSNCSFAPAGDYSEKAPEKVIFDTGTRLRVGASHWKVFSLILAVVAFGAVWTRQSPPSVVKILRHVIGRRLSGFKFLTIVFRTAAQ